MNKALLAASASKRAAKKKKKKAVKLTAEATGEAGDGDNVEQ